MSAERLLSLIAGRDTTGLYELRCRNPRTGAITAREWFRLDQHAACLGFMADKAPTLDVYLGAALRTGRAGGKDAIARVWCLWVDLDADTDALRGFSASPSMVVCSGTPGRFHVYWAISEPLSAAWAERANRRLAHRLGADMKATDAARILRPPGTLNHKHDPPQEVVVFSSGVAVHNVARLAGCLPDPPSFRLSRAPRPDVDRDDPLRGVSAERYYVTLTGRPVSAGNVQCPFHAEGKERTPSMRLYETTYYCWGCCEGGSVYEFAAKLWGYPRPVRGAEFKALKERLADVLR